MKKLVTLMLAAVLLMGLAVGFMGCDDSTTDVTTAPTGNGNGGNGNGNGNGGVDTSDWTRVYVAEVQEAPVAHRTWGHGFEGNMTWLNNFNPDNMGTGYALTRQWMVRNGAINAVDAELGEVTVLLPLIAYYGNFNHDAIVHMTSDEGADDWSFTFEISVRDGASVGTFTTTLASAHNFGDAGILRFLPTYWSTPWTPTPGVTYDLVVTINDYVNETQYVFPASEVGYTFPAAE